MTRCWVSQAQPNLLFFGRISAPRHREADGRQQARAEVLVRQALKRSGIEGERLDPGVLYAHPQPGVGIARSRRGPSVSRPASGNAARRPRLKNIEAMIRVGMSSQPDRTKSIRHRYQSPIQTPYSKSASLSIAVERPVPLALWDRTVMS